MVKISVVIITYNEEKNIARCIDSVMSVADEIVVIDSFSKDRTKELCLAKGVLFFEHAFRNHIDQKNYAVTKASHQYILSLRHTTPAYPIRHCKKIKINYSKEKKKKNQNKNF
jgi:glycosyltransferase involved in cell wall biosynthesis